MRDIVNLIAETAAVEIGRTPGIGLDPGGLAAAFPFHFACNDSLEVVQTGRSLGLIAPDVLPGIRLQDCFSSAFPERVLTRGFIASRAGTLILLRHAASSLSFRGQFLRTEAPAGWVFLGSPWFSTSDALEAAGLTLNDFAPHDPIAELLLVAQTQQMAIADLQRLNEKLRDSQEETRRLAIVTARTSNAVVITDAERHIEWVNEGFTRLTGFSLDQVRGRMMRHVFGGPEADPVMFERAMRAMSEGIEFRSEMKLHGADSQVFWLAAEIQPLRDSAGAITGFIAVGADITAAKLYEQRLARLRDELDAILRVTPGGVVAFDADGTVAYCNPAFETLAGLSGTQLVGMTAADVDAVFAYRCGEQQLPMPFLELTEGDTDVMRLSRPELRVIERTVRSIHEASAAAEWRACYLRDITRETEVDRMKSEFLSTAAHELRTPMSSVHGFAELLVSRDFDTDTSRTIARTIHRQSSLLVQMVNELLDLARIESGQGRDFAVEKQPLGPIVAETVAGLLVPDDPRRPELLPGDGESASVLVDGAKLRHAITNVLANAFKYSRGKGAVRVSMPVRAAHNRREVGIRVDDEGIGMSREQLAHVFERFYRADPSGPVPGTGLGMTLVKEIVERMKGSVEISSEPGRGTSVTLWLPAME